MIVVVYLLKEKFKGDVTGDNESVNVPTQFFPRKNIGRI